MTPDGRDDRRTRLLALLTASDRGEGTEAGTPGHNHLVFDFGGLERPGLADLALVLTARLGAGPEGTVWVRQMPYATWQILRGLGLDHLFHVYPGPGEELN